MHPIPLSSSMARCYCKELFESVLKLEGPIFPFYGGMVSTSALARLYKTWPFWFSVVLVITQKRNKFKEEHFKKKKPKILIREYYFSHIHYFSGLLIFKRCDLKTLGFM
jgi:hypothetical protein